MVLKGYLNCEKFAHTNINLYTPVIEENETVIAAMDHCLDKFFDNNIFPVFAHFICSEKFSQEEIEKLKGLIDKINGEKQI